MNGSVWSNLQPDSSLCSFKDFIEPSMPKPLKIAVVNCMPDAALRATERQLCSLFGAASSGLLVQLKFYTLPGIRRSQSMQAHIDTYYEDLHEIDDDRPDGLFMTGTEPGASSLQEEAFWPSMAYVINLCHDTGIPAIWSCLAAHAAVFETDGIARVRLPKKVSGVFECRVHTSKHEIFHRLPRKWSIPHSRLHGLKRADLERHGYDIVSGSHDVGVDIFIKRCECIQVFLQGHPEYDPGSLPAEYQRDVLRAYRGQRDQLPALPLGLGGRASRLAARDLVRSIRLRDETALLASLATITQDLRPQESWVAHARKLVESWLAYIEARKQHTPYKVLSSRHLARQPALTSPQSLHEV